MQSWDSEVAFVEWLAHQVYPRLKRFYTNVSCHTPAFVRKFDIAVLLRIIYEF